MKSARYYECHITVEPIDDVADRDVLRGIAQEHGFRLAELHMQKRPKDSAVRSKYDDFLTTRGDDYDDVRTRTLACVQELHDTSYKVWRVKIEDTMFDTKCGDTELLGHKVTKYMTPRYEQDPLSRGAEPGHDMGPNADAVTKCGDGKHSNPHKGCVLR